MTDISSASASPNKIPLVSVVVPAFNAAAYLGDALSSLRAQTLTDIEIIVVDDGSTDGTAAIARNHASEDDRIRLVTMQQSSGRPACARNAGLRVAKGKYIALLDADDISIETRLESAVHAMQLTGTLFAFADMRRLYQETGNLAAESTLASSEFLKNAAPYLEHMNGNVYLCSASFPAFLLTYVAVNTQTVVFDRELLRLEPKWFDESLIRFEDVDMWYRWAEHTRLVFVNEVHTFIRKHAESITATDPVSTRIDGITVQSAHFERLRERLSATEVAAAATHISGLQFHMAYSQWRSGRGTEARKWFLESWRMKPTFAALFGYLKANVPYAVANRLRKGADEAAD